MQLCQTLFILPILYFHSVTSSCSWVEGSKRFSCDNPIEVSVEGQEDWSNVIVYSNNKPYVLKKNSFKRTPNLKTLTLGTVKRFEEGALNGLTKLDRFVVFDSDIEEVPKGLLDGLPVRSLQFISKIHKIADGFFENLPDVREVDIRKNSLGHIKKGIFNGTSIYKLWLDNDEIESIEEGAFANMDYNIFLSLTGNKLKTFDAQTVLGESNVVQQLWLNKNFLTKITKKMFTGLDSLQNLYLEINQIDEIEDKTMTVLPQLTFLDISNNRLTEIQPEIWPKSGSKLYYFFIQNNRITFLNNAVFLRNPAIHFISYGGNPFQCPCLQETKEWTDKNKITRLCDDVYFSGERPVCVFSDLSRDECIYDDELTEDLYDMYQKALEEYPKLELKCDTTKGVANATLTRGD